MKHFYFLIGLLCIALGSLGVVLPVLPTVPFLLAASLCFARSSRRFNDWFVSTRLYENHLQSLIQSNALTLKEKINILGFSTLILLTVFTLVELVYARIIILITLAFKYYYFICRIKTLNEH